MPVTFHNTRMNSCHRKCPHI